MKYILAFCLALLCCIIPGWAGDDGETRTLGLFGCESEATGLTCQDGDGQGFFLSKGRQELF